jgi:hypothetical protein
VRVVLDFLESLAAETSGSMAEGSRSETRTLGSDGRRFVVEAGGKEPMLGIGVSVANVLVRLSGLPEP